MAEFRTIASVMNEQNGVGLQEIRPQINLDHEEFRKVFERPFAAPLPSESAPQNTQVKTSHYDYNFDEKDYKNRRISSTSFHEPLKRIQSRSRNLEKLDKTDGGSKKHKRRSQSESISVLPKIKEGQVSLDEDFQEEKENQEVLKSVDKKKHHHRHHSRHHHERKADHKEHKTPKNQKDLGDKKPHHHHHHHRHQHRRPPPALHHHRTISEREQLESRLRSGALTLREIEPIQERLATEKDEASVLAKKDLEEMAWHRFEDLRGLRRRRPHLPRHKSGMKTHYSISDISKSLQRFPVKYDHSPHEAFVELEQLTKNGEEMEWQETARWIKFEENVEDSNRWGKPHVASLTFHSLLELRKNLEKGTVMLDLEKFDLPSIAEAVVENMVITDQLSQTNSNKVLAALLLRHRHQHQMAPIARRPSSYNLLALARKDSKTAADDSEQKIVDPGGGGAMDDGVIRLRIDETDGDDIPIQETSQLPLTTDNKQELKQEVSFAPEPPTVEGGGGKQESDVKSKIPEGAEATTVLVGTLDELEQPVLAFVRLAKGCPLNITEVSIPVRFLFVLLGPSSGEESYYEIGRSVATLMSDQAFHDIAYRADSREDLLTAINGFLDDTVVLPPGEWDRNVLLPILVAQSKAMARRRKMAKAALAAAAEEQEIDPLERTGSFCGGLALDIKRRAKFYLSDFKDGFNVQCLLTSIFLYFSVFAPNVAFGSLLDKKTDGWLGVSEVIFATCLCGILFGLLAGQPLIIIGATGPVLVFEQTIYEFCDVYQLEFLPWRCWIGFWVMLILFGVVAMEGCFLVRYFTRFTEEIFACLISAIFIYEAIHFLELVFNKNPLKKSYSESEDSSAVEVKGQPNTALLSTIMVLGTFLVAFYLRKFRTSYFFGKKARRLVSDFGIVIAMATMLLLDIFLHDKVTTPKIAIGDPTKRGFLPTRYTERGWFINPGGMTKAMETGWIFAAIIPAMFVGILLFMETELTGVLINKKEHKLTKGAGFNLDLCIMGLLSFICSLMGLPWMCAATVRSVSHLNALSIWSTSHAPGVKPHLIEVKEQRVTNIAIHVLTGVSILLAPALHRIPVPVMFGVLLYLGVCSLSGIQLVDRLIMMFMPPKYHPDVQYVRKVKTKQIHSYTMIQLVCLALLIFIKLTVVAPSFPFFIICLIPLRKSLKKFFEENELEELDNEEAPDDDSDLDEYDSVFLPI
ncbi:band 3 anion transport protein-like [Oculina patagonica]